MDFNVVFIQCHASEENHPPSAHDSWKCTLPSITGGYLVQRTTSSEFMSMRLCHDVFFHDDVIKWKYFPRYWPFVWGIHRSSVNSPQKGQWRGALIFSLICAWINCWVSNREAGYFRRHRTHYDITAMVIFIFLSGSYSYRIPVIQLEYRIHPSNFPCDNLNGGLTKAWMRNHTTRIAVWVVITYPWFSIK